MNDPDPSQCERARMRFSATNSHTTSTLGRVLAVERPWERRCTHKLVCAKILCTGYRLCTGELGTHETLMLPSYLETFCSLVAGPVSFERLD